MFVELIFFPILFAFLPYFVGCCCCCHCHQHLKLYCIFRVIVVASFFFFCEVESPDILLVDCTTQRNRKLMDSLRFNIFIFFFAFFVYFSSWCGKCFFLYFFFFARPKTDSILNAKFNLKTNVRNWKNLRSTTTRVTTCNKNWKKNS